MYVVWNSTLKDTSWQNKRREHPTWRWAQVNIRYGPSLSHQHLINFALKVQYLQSQTTLNDPIIALLLIVGINVGHINHLPKNKKWVGLYYFCASFVLELAFNVLVNRHALPLTITHTCKSDFQSGFCRCLHRRICLCNMSFGCVKRTYWIGKSWRTWETDQITPTYSNLPLKYATWICAVCAYLAGRCVL